MNVNIFATMFGPFTQIQEMPLPQSECATQETLRKTLRRATKKPLLSGSGFNEGAISFLMLHNQLGSLPVTLLIGGCNNVNPIGNIRNVYLLLRRFESSGIHLVPHYHFTFQRL